ncbi:unnamed protein product [Schistosoma margrebowiei]|uniref:Uncharacterized protein n=3 Tax=Schistosoma margrebowiei TaxID=48269 RepID=A0AA85AIG0_9TREM|nr:unnamed protein product [Schistosoma margrebowiei]
MIENLEWKSIDGINMINQMEHVNRLLVVSTYTKLVLILVAIQTSVTLFVLMILSILRMEFPYGEQMIPSVFSGLFLLIALAVFLLIAIVKKIDENYLLNLALVIVFSVCMATALGVLTTQLNPQVKLAIFGISLMIFACGLLFGAAIKTDLFDHPMSILIFLLVISIVIVIVAVVLSVFNQCKHAAIGVYIGAQISLFIITVFISYVTVGKSRYLLFYPNYSLAAILLYIMFFSTLLINTNIKIISTRLKVVYSSSGFNIA